MFKPWNAVAMILLFQAAIGITGCNGQPTTAREQRTITTAGFGGATGAIIGAAIGAPGAGAAIGGLIGGIGGFAVGNSEQNKAALQAQTQRNLQQHEIEQQRQDVQRLQAQEETQ